MKVAKADQPSISMPKAVCAFKTVSLARPRRNRTVISVLSPGPVTGFKSLDPPMPLIVLLIILVLLFGGGGYGYYGGGLGTGGLGGIGGLILIVVILYFFFGRGGRGI